MFPYLLQGLRIERAQRVWCADITYVPLQRGFLYSVAVMDWVSRCVLSQEVSTTLDSEFCMLALEAALATHPAPDIFDTDPEHPVHRAGVHRLSGGRWRADPDGRPGV